MATHVPGASVLDVDRRPGSSALGLSIGLLAGLTVGPLASPRVGKQREQGQSTVPLVT